MDLYQNQLTWLGNKKRMIPTLNRSHGEAAERYRQVTQSARVVAAVAVVPSLATNPPTNQALT